MAAFRKHSGWRTGGGNRVHTREGPFCTHAARGRSVSAAGDGGTPAAIDKLSFTDTHSGTMGDAPPDDQKLKMQPGRRFTLPPQIYPVCALCGLPAKCICALCFEALYCSRQCQIKAWPQHVGECNLVQVGGAVGPIAIAERAALLASASSNGNDRTPVTDANANANAHAANSMSSLQPPDAPPAPRTKRSEKMKAMAPPGAPSDKGGKGKRVGAPAPKAAKAASLSSAAMSASAANQQYVIENGLYKCPVPGCGKSYKQSSSLRSHSRVHTGERPFVCDFDNCGKAFSAGFALRRHKRIHTGEKSFKCDVCTKTFSRKDALRQHERVHTRGEGEGEGEDGEGLEEDM